MQELLMQQLGSRSVQRPRRLHPRRHLPPRGPSLQGLHTPRAALGAELLGVFMLGDAGQFLLLIMGDGCQQASEAEQEESDPISPTLHIMGILSFQGRHLREESAVFGLMGHQGCQG